MKEFCIIAINRLPPGTVVLNRSCIPDGVYVSEWEGEREREAREGEREGGREGEQEPERGPDSDP